MAALANTVSDIDRFVRKYKRGMVNSLLEFLILDYAANGSLCGYEIITALYERFHILLSPGQVYPVIDQMFEQGLIRKEKRGRALVLVASYLGQSLLKAWHQEFRAIQAQLADPEVPRLQALA